MRTCDSVESPSTAVLIPRRGFRGSHAQASVTIASRMRLLALLNFAIQNWILRSQCFWLWSRPSDQILISLNRTATKNVSKNVPKNANIVPSQSSLKLVLPKIFIRFELQTCQRRFNDKIACIQMNTMVWHSRRANGGLSGGIYKRMGTRKIAPTIGV